MFAANVFHWWLGVGLTLASVGGVLAVIGGYLKKVTAQQYPGKKYHEE